MLPRFARSCSTSVARYSLRKRWASVALMILLGVGCKPTVGSSCDKGEARCVDGKHELVCQAGKFIESPCNGPAGCGTTARGTSCDFSGNQAGDACSTDEEGTAICANRDGMLACHAGRYAIVPCRGGHGCLNAEGRALCDTSVAEAGDPCNEESLKACSSDGTKVLICKQHAMKPFYSCRGDNGCISNAGKLSCDTSVAKLGDACDKRLEGQSFACSADGAAILVCKGGAFDLDQTCKAGQKCVSSGSATQCSKPGK